MGISRDGYGFGTHDKSPVQDLDAQLEEQRLHLEKLALKEQELRNLEAEINAKKKHIDIAKLNRKKQTIDSEKPVTTEEKNRILTETLTKINVLLSQEGKHLDHPENETDEKAVSSLNTAEEWKNAKDLIPYHNMQDLQDKLAALSLVEQSFFKLLSMPPQIQDLGSLWNQLQEYKKELIKEQMSRLHKLHNYSITPGIFFDPASVNEEFAHFWNKTFPMMMAMERVFLDDIKQIIEKPHLMPETHLKNLEKMMDDRFNGEPDDPIVYFEEMVKKTNSLASKKEHPSANILNQIKRLKKLCKDLENLLPQKLSNKEEQELQLEELEEQAKLKKEKLENLKYEINAKERYIARLNRKKERIESEKTLTTEEKNRILTETLTKINVLLPQAGNRLCHLENEPHEKAVSSFKIAEEWKNALGFARDSFNEFFKNNHLFSNKEMQNWQDALETISLLENFIFKLRILSTQPQIHRTIQENDKQDLDCCWNQLQKYKNDLRAKQMLRLYELDNHLKKRASAPFHAALVDKPLAHFWRQTFPMMMAMEHVFLDYIKAQIIEKPHLIPTKTHLENLEEMMDNRFNGEPDDPNLYFEEMVQKTKSLASPEVHPSENILKQVQQMTKRSKQLYQDLQNLLSQKPSNKNVLPLLEVHRNNQNNNLAEPVPPASPNKPLHRGQHF